MNVASDAIPVILCGGEQPSGLAEMLQQFIEQTVAESPHKARLARRLSGRVVFRSAEDDELCVRITFTGDRIEVQDGAGGAAETSISSDFLSIAHLTSGQESPLRLLAQRKLQVRFSASQVPFLLGMLRFMRIESTRPRVGYGRWALSASAVAAVAAGVYWYLTAM
jgi:ubiquinone biosynthesis protein UbiJ